MTLDDYFQRRKERCLREDIRKCLEKVQYYVKRFRDDPAYRSDPARVADYSTAFPDPRLSLERKERLMNGPETEFERRGTYDTMHGVDGQKVRWPGW